MFAFDYRSSPFPHLVIDRVFPEASHHGPFPDGLSGPDNGWGLTEADCSYAEVLRDPGWGALYRHLKSESFVRSVLELFADDMKRAGCLVEAASARVVPYVESLDDKHRPTLGLDVGANELFTRIDFLSRGPGQYRSFVHLDWPRRVVGGLLFFSNSEDEGIEGGQLTFYDDAKFCNDRWCHEPVSVQSFPLRANTGVLFLNTNGSFHGPAPILAQRGNRRWIYYAISSRADVWPSVPIEGMPSTSSATA